MAQNDEKNEMAGVIENIPIPQPVYFNFIVTQVIVTVGIPVASFSYKRLVTVMHS